MQRFWSIGLLLLTAAPAAAQDMPLADILIPKEGWQVAADDCKAVHGLVADRAGDVYVADAEKQHLTRIAGGEVKGVTMNEQGLYGLAMGPDNRLYASQPSKHRILAREADGKLSIVAMDVTAHDLVVTRDGTVYCTIPDAKSVFVISPGGKRAPAEDDLSGAAGLVLWPDQGTLVAGQASGNKLWAFRIEKDGVLTSKEGYYSLRGHADHSPSGLAALTVDDKGRVYAATGVGIQVFDTSGRLSGVILKPEDAPVTALTFGGAAHDKLFISCGSRIYSRKTRAKGVVAEKIDR
jgi:sugar lactone lactonase YvrE